MVILESTCTYTSCPGRTTQGGVDGLELGVGVDAKKFSQQITRKMRLNISTD